MIAYILFKIKKYKVMIPTAIITTILTLVFIYVFGNGFSQTYVPTIVIVDEDQSETSIAITDQLMKHKSYSFKKGELKAAKSDLEKKQITGVVLFEKGFEGSLTTLESRVVFYRNGVSIEAMNMENNLKQYISEAISDDSFPHQAAEYLPIDEAALRSRFEDNNKGYVTYELDSSYYSKTSGEYNVYKYNFSGFILFFTMFTIMFGIGSIVEEKEIYIWQRQMVSPLSSATILIGDLISNFIVSMLQMSAVVLLSRIIFKIEWGGSTLALLLVLGAYVMAGTALGLFIACLVRTQQQLGAILPTVVVATSMIGGTMWPREIMNNKVLLAISDLLPQRWAMKGLLDVIMYNGSLKDVLQPILILLIITTVLLLASLKPYRKVI